VEQKFARAGGGGTVIEVDLKGMRSGWHKRGGEKICRAKEVIAYLGIPGPWRRLWRRGQGGWRRRHDTIVGQGHGGK
jgi:hypothetical protein